MLDGEVLADRRGRGAAAAAVGLLPLPAPASSTSIVGAGDGPLARRSRSADASARGSAVYPVDPVALKHGAGVETETEPSPKEAYAAFSPDRSRCALSRGLPAGLTKSIARGRHAGRAVCDAGPRALVVRARAARARAHEARAPAAPVPREVHPAARRGAARPLLHARRARARSVRRLRDDARAGARVGARRDRRRARGVQLPADRRQDGARTTSRRSAPSCATCARVSTRCRRSGARPRAYVREWYAPGAIAQLLAFRDLVGEYEHRDVLRVILSRAARSARRAAHFDLEAPREPQTGEYWCHKHKRLVPAGRVGGRLPAALHARHAGADRGVRGDPRRRVRGARRAGGLARRSSTTRRSTACSRRRRIRA